MRNLRLLLCLGLMLGFCSLSTPMWASTEYVIHYDIRLINVTCDQDCGFVQELKAEPFRNLDGAPCARFIYEDDVLKMSWYVSDIALNYSIVNKLDSTLVLLAHTIMYQGPNEKPSSVGYTLERQITWPVVYVGPDTYTMGFMIPESKYPPDNRKSIVKPLLPNYFNSERQAWRNAAWARGNQLSLELPVYQGERTWIYHLTFEVAGAIKVTSHDADDSIADNEDADNLSEQDPARDARKEREQEEARKEAEAMAAARPGADSCYLHGLCPQEKVYLHLDNTAYFEGETIWYAANVVDVATGHQPASKVLYVELLSPTGVVLKQQKLKIVDGRCHGSFPLIDADVKEAVALRGALPYPSGYYQIRAYTRSMLNFDEACIFSRVVPVYEAPAEEGAYDHPLLLPYDSYERDRPDVKRSERLDEMNVTFYPEGGHLVSGVPCRVAFKVVDNHGMGVVVDSIHDVQGQNIPLLLQHKGMGVIRLTVRRGGRLTFFVGGQKASFNLPAVSDENCALLYTGEEDSLRFQISWQGDALQGVLHYVLTSGGKRCADGLLPSASVDETGLHTTILALPRQPLPTGVAQFTLCNETGTILSQRLLFVDNGLPVMRLTTTMSSTDIQPYDSVNLCLKSEQEGPYTFSLAVRDAADYGTAYREDIRTYMLLSSELRGLIEEPAWYFGDAPAEERAAALDLLMMVQGWTRHDYAGTLDSDSTRVAQWPEEGLVIDGWAFSRILERPLKSTKVTAKLYSPNRKYKQRAVTFTDSTGYWRLNIADFDNEWDLFLFTEQPVTHSSKRTTRLRLGRSVAFPLRAYRPEELFLPDYQGDQQDMLTWKKTKDEGSMVQMFPDIKDIFEDSHLLDEVQVEGKRKYIDYNRFHAFNASHDNELVRDKGEYVGDVLGYLEAKGYSYSLNYHNLYPGVSDVIGYNDLGVEIDGHHTKWTGASPMNKGPLNEMQPIWALDMEDVKSVIIYDYEPGHRFVEVVVIPLLKQEHKNNTKNSRQTTFKGYDTPVEFYAPTYPNGPIQGDKDYRRTLYWNPEVRTDSTGSATVSFYNNGYSRSLTVSAEGLTQDGVPILNE